MEIILALFITYLIGIFVMAGIIRWGNSKEKYAANCLEPHLCLTSWLGIGICIAIVLAESAKKGFIARLFKYTNKS